MLKKLGLRSEIVLQLSLLMGAAIIFISITILTNSEQELLEGQVRQNLAVIELYAGLCSYPTTSQLFTTQVETTKGKHLIPLGLELLIIRDRNLKLLYTTSEQTAAAQIEGDWRQTQWEKSRKIRVRYSKFAIPFGDRPLDHMIVTQPIIRRGHLVGIIQARFSLSSVRDSSQQAQQYVLLFSLLYGLVTILFGSHLLGKSIVKPIVNLQKATRRIAGGDLGQAIEPVGPLEVAALANDFNYMCDELKSTRLQTDQQLNEMARLNQKLEHTRNELIQSAKMASIGHLAAGMAHEIGNPLGALLGYIKYLQSTTQESQIQDVLKRSIIEAERIDSLIRELLDYAQPDECLEPIHLEAVVTGILEKLVYQGELQKEQLITRIAAQLPSILISARKLEQVLINLLTNALDACDIKSQVSITAFTSNRQVVLEIADQGEGIREADLAHLFDPFFTTKPPGKGRGLGLFVSHRIINDAGGLIEVESTLGKGTIFRILLPAAERVLNEV